MTKALLSSKDRNTTKSGFGPNPSSSARRKLVAYTGIALALVAAGTSLYFYAISVLNFALSFLRP
jgi:hypothetical protein